MDRYRGKLRFTSPHAFQLPVNDQQWKTVFQEIKGILQVLAPYDKNQNHT
jgi:hypothetical protein